MPSSEFSHGSFRLPTLAPEHDPSGTLIAPGGNGDNRRILIVDDEAHVTTGIARNLRPDFTVLTSNSGIEAIDLVKEHGPFAVILSDLRMPGMDGVELFRRIRVLCPESIRIMLSGNADLATTVQAVNCGGIHHLLLKPIAAEELHNVLDQACANFNQQARERALALEDPLLGIGTRRALENAMHRVHSYAVRHQGTYSLVMLDVDNFKLYNDSYGHLAGDRVLRSIAQTVSTACRREDETFRFGGEEIVLLLSNTNESSAAIVCERIRVRVQELRISHTGSESGHVTVSLGVAASYPVARPEMLELLNRADQALYQAKAQGRNRVIAWQSTSGSSAAI